MKNYAPFVDYFKRKYLGSEPPIMTILSYLPPRDRVEILSQLAAKNDHNPNIYDKLLMALLKNGEAPKAYNLLETIYKNDFVNEHFYRVMKDKLQMLQQQAGFFNPPSSNYNETLRLVQQGMIRQEEIGIASLCKEFNQIMISFCNSNL